LLQVISTSVLLQCAAVYCSALQFSSALQHVASMKRRARLEYVAVVYSENAAVRYREPFICCRLKVISTHNTFEPHLLSLTGNMLQCTAKLCSALQQHIVTHCNIELLTHLSFYTDDMLQRAAAHYKTLQQHTVTHSNIFESRSSLHSGNTMQRTATHCSALQQP